MLTRRGRSGCGSDPLGPLGGDHIHLGGPFGGDHIHHLLARYLESACTGCDHGFKSFHIRENQSAWLTERKPTPLRVEVRVSRYD